MSLYNQSHILIANIYEQEDGLQRVVSERKDAL
jgi:hypothetical protein